MGQFTQECKNFYFQYTGQGEQSHTTACLVPSSGEIDKIVSILVQICTSFERKFILDEVCYAKVSLSYI